MAITTYLADVWSATTFRNPGLAGYAEAQIRKDTRLGVQTMAGLALLMQATVAALLLLRGIDVTYLKTNVIFGALSLHILISAAFVKDVRTLQVLGMTFLVIGALAITFLAHRTGDLNIGMIAAIVMLFIAIPLVPWALREATIVIVLTYVLLTSSLVSVPGRFDSGAIWILQLLVLGAALIGIVVTGRNTFLRKQDIRARYALEKAHDELELLSMQDHLTGAWNRRFLQERFSRIARICLEKNVIMHMAILDVDDFKGINDAFGHQIGDDILVCIAKVFMRQIGDHGRLIRLGGDEFLIIYWGRDLDALVDRAIADLQKSSAAAGLQGDRRVTLSAGIVSAEPGQCADLEFMYKTADNALYRAKHDRLDSEPDAPSATNALARTGTWKL